MDKIIDKAMKRGAEYADIRFLSKEGTRLELKDGELKKSIYGKDGGTSMRVLYKGAWGFFSTNDLSKKSLENALDTAFKLAKGSSTMVKERIHLADVKAVKAKKILHAKKNPQDISIEEKHNLIMNMYSAISEIKGVHTVTAAYGDGTEIQHILNSDGADLYSQVTRIFVYARIIAREGKNVVGFSTSTGGTGGFEIFDLEDPIKKGVKAGESAVRILSAKKAPGGKMTIITDHNLTGVFAHEALGHATEGDSIVSGNSCLEGKIGERIGSEKVTIIDDPSVKNAFGSFPFDAEGVKAQRKILVENGILKNYILNRETAYKLKMTPNGGARAESYSVHPLVRMSNTFIDNGDHSFEELIEDIKTGVYVKGSRGGQVSTAKGTFQFNAQEAFLIKNGEITTPLKDVSIAGSTLQTLKNIDACGNDFKLGDPGSCGKGQWVPVSDGGPHIRVRNIVLGGGP